MARSRNIKPGFFTNERLAECDPLARLLFAGLWCFADREGRLEYRPKRIKAEILPYDRCNIDKLLAQLVEGGFIHRYSIGPAEYIAIPNFTRHQNPHVREPASTLPAPGQHCASTGLDPEKPEPARPLTDSLSLDSLSPASQAADAAKASPEVIPFDTKAAIFGEQLAWLRETTARSEKSLRSWLGQCCGKYGDAAVLAAILAIRSQPTPVDPISRMRSTLERQEGRVNGRHALTPAESLYAGAALALAERERARNRGEDRDAPEPLLDSGGRSRSAKAPDG